MPSWGWTVIVLTVVITAVGLVFKSLLETYEGFAKAFGGWGRKAYAHGTVRRNGPAVALVQKEMKRVLEYVEQMEIRLEMINAYLVVDAHWHHGVDVFLAEQGLILPDRHVAYSDFSRRWRTGWRPPEIPTT